MMEGNATALIACECLAAEIETIAQPELRIHQVEMGLHDYPKKLNEEIRNVLAGLEEEKRWDTILLGFGLCSEGTVGLKARHARLVVPRTDDCIAIYLGSQHRYLEQFQKEPGTYYYTKGFLKDDADPLAMYLGEHKWTKKYSKEQAKWIAREIMKNYRRIAFIDTGVYDITPYEEKAKKAAALFGFQYELLPGSLELLKRLINGPWDERFIVVEPGHEITREMFICQ
jgi:hypothetical protein